MITCHTLVLLNFSQCFHHQKCYFLVATTMDIFKKFHSESLTKRCRVYEWLCRRVEVVCISKKCRTAAHRSVKTVSCKAIGRSAWKSNQDKHLDKYLSFLGWIRASLRESAIFSNQEELSFSNNMFSHHDDIIILQTLTFQMMASVSGNSLAASLLRTASSGEI